MSEEIEEKIQIDKNIMKEIVREIVNTVQHPYASIHKFINSSATIILVCVAIYLGYSNYTQKLVGERNANQLELINKYYVTQSQQTLLLTVLDKNLRDSDSAAFGSAPMEEKVAVQKIIYDMATLRKIPISLLLGIAEVESKFNTHAVSGKGCAGLLQVTLMYCRPYLRENKIDYKKDILFDPVVNCICGIGMLCDFQNSLVESGITTTDNFTFALHSYFWGPSSRNNVYDLNYSIKVIDAMKRYQKIGIL